MAPYFLYRALLLSRALWTRLKSHALCSLVIGCHLGPRPDLLRLLLGTDRESLVAIVWTGHCHSQLLALMSSSVSSPNSRAGNISSRGLIPSTVLPVLSVSSFDFTLSDLNWRMKQWAFSLSMYYIFILLIIFFHINNVILPCIILKRWNKDGMIGKRTSNTEQSR